MPANQASRRRVGSFVVLVGGAWLVGCSENAVPVAPDGAVFAPDGAVFAPDGAVFTPDGAVFTPDGAVFTPDGAVFAPDAAVFTPDGAVFTPDGAVFAPDAAVFAPDGAVFDVPPVGTDAGTDAGGATSDLGSVDAGARLAAWSRSYGDRSDQDCFALALDPAGDVILSTYIIGTVNFGNGPLSGMDRVAVARLGPTGDTRWSRIYPNGGHQYSTGVALAPSGAIFLTGGFEGTLNFGGTALVSAGGDDVFSAGLTAAGATSWSHRYGDPALYQKGLDVATDRLGNAVFVGELSGGATFGGAAFVGSNRDAFVVKIDAAGNHLWSRSWGDGAMQVATGVALDDAGNVLITGRLDGRVDLGGGPIGSGVGLFLARLTAAGGYSFARTFATAQPQVMRSRVGADAAGNIYVAGSVLGAIDFGGGMVPGRGDFDAFVAKFDSTGRLVWHHEYGDALRQEVTDIAVDAAGNVALIGVFDGTLDFGGGVLASRGGDEFVGGDVFVAKLGPDGSHRFSARYGDALAQRGQSIALDARGDVVVAGAFRGQLDLGSGPLTSAGGTDIFVARIQLP